MNKKAAMGELLQTISRIIAVSFLALIVLGTSSVAYAYQVDIKNSEAILMTRQIVDCIAPKGVLDLSYIKEKEKEGLLNYCVKSGTIKDRFFIRIIIKNEEDKEIATIQEGDEGALWIKDLFNTNKEASEFIKKYKPGYSKEEFSSNIKNNGEIIRGKLNVEVLVRNEE